MATNRHPDWHPDLLRHHRDASGWTLEQVAEAIRNMLPTGAFRPPRATFQSVGRHERGDVYPGPQYRRAYCALYGSSQPELGFRRPLPGEPQVVTPVQDDAMRRRDLLKSLASSPIVAHPPTEHAVTERDCVYGVAWEMAQRRCQKIHDSELPDELSRALGEIFRRRSRGAPESIIASGLISRDGFGNYSFIHPSYIDLFTAQTVFSDISAGKSARLATVQTRHETDEIISDFIRADQPSEGTLVRWMKSGSKPVMRVNSAGILAKLGSPATGDSVVTALRQDDELRTLYVAAVTARILEAEWGSALKLAHTIDRFDPIPQERRSYIAAHFAKEVRNHRDVGARWSSIFVLSRLGEAGIEIARPALAEAVSEETSRETLRAIGCTLAGSDPLSL